MSAEWLFVIPGFAVGIELGAASIRLADFYKFLANIGAGADANSFTANYSSGGSIKANGSGLTYDPSGNVDGGTITSLEFRNTDGSTMATLSGLASVPADAVYNALISPSGSTNTLLQFITTLVDDDTTVTGTSGSDGAIVGAGNDTATMGGGDDGIAKFSAGNLTYDGGSGSDTLSFKADFDDAYPNTPVQQLIVNLGTGTGQNPYGGTLSLTSVENIVGTDQADNITGSGAANVIGDGKFDIGADTINTLGGNDTVKLAALSGGVTADGGTGTDTLYFNYTTGPVNTLDLGNQANNSGVFAGGLFTNFEVFVVGTDFSTSTAALNFTGTNQGESLAVQSGAIDADMRGGNDTFTLASFFVTGPVTANGGGGKDTLIFNQAVGTNTLDLTKQTNNSGVFANGVFAGFESFKTLVLDFGGTPFTNGIFDFRGNGSANDVEGSFGNDLIRGGGGKDTLNGGLGNDKLWGQGSKDKFVFDTALGGANVDKVKDFEVNKDMILLDKGIFKKVGKSLSKKEFEIGKKAGDKNDHIIYNKKNGNLIYDENGSKQGGDTLFAKLDKKLKLDHNDFDMTA